MTLPTNWRKSSRSQNGGNCVELAMETGNPVGAVRDSKNVTGAPLALPVEAVAALVRSLR